MPLPTLARTALAVTVTAVAGSLATDPRSSWYRSLDKPSWQPPPPAYGLVWTLLYADLAVVGARALDRLPVPERAHYRRALAANLVLNAGWNWLFFRRHRPWLAAAEGAVLTASSAELVRRTARSEPGAAAAPAPTRRGTFATALTVALAQRNPHPAPRTGRGRSADDSVRPHPGDLAGPWATDR
jgi:tryptophan-rich sensory protein